MKGLKSRREAMLSLAKSSGSLSAFAIYKDNGNDSYKNQENCKIASSLNNGRTVSVKSPPFNAQGDGIADDTDAINAAIAYSSSQGPDFSRNVYRPVVYMPQGVYKIKSLDTIRSANGLVLRGDGTYATRIIIDKSNVRPVLQLGDFEADPKSSFDGDVQNVYIEDLSIYCEEQSSLYGAQGVSTGNNNANSLNDTNSNYEENSFSGCSISIIKGTGIGQMRKIISNSRTEFEVQSWGEVPDETSEYVVSFPKRNCTAIQDNGCGGLRLQRVRIQGFEYGVCQRHGSDFCKFDDVEIRYCDVGIYLGPGTQQFEYSRIDTNGCRIGIVFDAAMQGVVRSSTFILNEIDILFEATGTSRTRAGLISSPVQVQKNYDNSLCITDCWFETGAGNVKLPYDQVNSVKFTGHNSTTSGVAFVRPQIWSGTGGMTKKEDNNLYAWVNVQNANFLNINRPMIYGNRIDYIVDNGQGTASPHVNIVDPYFSGKSNIRGFSRPDKENIAMIASTLESVNSNVIASATDPWQIGSCRSFPKQSFDGVANASSNHVFHYQMPRGVHELTVRAGDKHFSGGIIKRAITVFEISDDDISDLHLYGESFAFGKNKIKDINLSINKNGILNVETHFTENSVMNVLVSYTVLQQASSSQRS